MLIAPGDPRICRGGFRHGPRSALPSPSDERGADPLLNLSDVVEHEIVSGVLVVPRDRVEDLAVRFADLVLDTCRHFQLGKELHRQVGEGVHEQLERQVARALGDGPMEAHVATTVTAPAHRRLFLLEHVSEAFDVLRPGMAGREAGDRRFDEQSGLRDLLVSGYSRLLLGLILSDFPLTFVVPSGIARRDHGLRRARADRGVRRGSYEQHRAGMFIILTYTRASGHRYVGSPIVWEEPGGPERLFREYVPTTWPGARLPHVWLENRTAMQDLIGDEYTLLRLGRTQADTSGLEGAMRTLAAPFPRPDRRRCRCERCVRARPDSAPTRHARRVARKHGAR